MSHVFESNVGQQTPTVPKVPQQGQASAVGWAPFASATVFLLLPFVPIGERAAQITLPTACAWIVLIYSTIRLTALGIRGEKRLISLTFWVFAYTLFGFVPLVQFTASQDSLAQQYSGQLIVATYGVILAGLIAFDLTSTFLRLSPVSALAARLFRERALSRARSMVLALFALVSTPLLIARFGGVAQLFLSRTERFRVLAEASGADNGQVQLQIVNALITTPAFIAFFAILALYLETRKHPRGQSWLLPFVILLGLETTIINNPISTARFLVGTIVLSLGLYLLPWRTKYSFSLTAVAITLLFIVVFPFADLFRYSVEVELTGYFQETNFESQIVSKGDYDGFEQVINSVDYVDRNGLGFGRHLLGTALFWFPRSVWPDKPVPSGQLIADYRGAENLNLSLPLWGEFYLDGHIAAVVVGFVIYGLLVGAAEAQYLQTNFSRPTFATLFVPVFSAYQFFLLRGSLLSATAYLTPIVLCILFCTTRSAGETGGDRVRIHARNISRHQL